MCVKPRSLIGFFLGIPFVWIGYEHFINPEIFDSIVPNYLGFPRFWTLASGVVEILLGIGIMLPPSRRLAARFLAIFLVFVYFANLKWSKSEILNQCYFPRARYSLISGTHSLINLNSTDISCFLPQLS